MTREEEIRKRLANWPSDQRWSDLRYLLDKVAQLTLSLTAARRVTTDQARRLTLLSSQRTTLVEEVCQLQPQPPVIVHVEQESDEMDVMQALRELHAESSEVVDRPVPSGPLEVHRYGHDGRPEPKSWGSE